MSENESIQYSLGYQDGFLDAKKQFERPQVTVCCENADKKTIEELKAELKRVINEARPRGEWKLHGMIYYCSVCGHDYEQGGNNFCGNCGADMRGEKK